MSASSRKDTVIVRNLKLLFGNELQPNPLPTTMSGFVWNADDEITQSEQHRFMLSGSTKLKKEAYICECKILFFSKTLAENHMSKFSNKSIKQSPVPTEYGRPDQGASKEVESVKKEKELHEAVDARRMLTTNELIVEFIFEEYGVEQKFPYRALCAQLLGMETEKITGQQKKAWKRKVKGQESPWTHLFNADVKAKGHKLNEETIEMLEKAVRLRREAKEKGEILKFPITNKKPCANKLLFEAIAIMYGTDVLTKKFKYNFSRARKLRIYDAQRFHKSIIVAQKLRKESVYKSLITPQIEKDAMKVYEEVKELNRCDWKRSLRRTGKTGRKDDRGQIMERLLMEAVFQIKGEDCKTEYVRKCTLLNAKLKPKTVEHWLRLWDARKNLGKENPYATKITPSIQKLAEKFIQDADSKDVVTKESKNVKSEGYFKAKRLTGSNVIMECIFEMYGTNVDNYYKDACCNHFGVLLAQIEIHLKKAIEDHRKNEGIEKVSQASDDIRKMAKKLHLKFEAEAKVARDLAERNVCDREGAYHRIPKLIMQWITVEYGNISNEWYIQSCADFLEEDLETIRAYCKEVPNKFAPKINEKLKQTIIEDAKRLHDFVMECMARAFRKTELLPIQPPIKYGIIA